MELCKCGHEEVEHNVDSFYVCSGIAEDQGVDIGCYCSGFKERTPKWWKQEKERNFKEMVRRREQDSLWYKIKKFFRV